MRGAVHVPALEPAATGAEPGCRSMLPGACRTCCCRAACRPRRRTSDAGAHQRACSPAPLYPARLLPHLALLPLLLSLPCSPTRLTNPSLSDPPLSSLLTSVASHESKRIRFKSTREWRSGRWEQTRQTKQCRQREFHGVLTLEGGCAACVTMPPALTPAKQPNVSWGCLAHTRRVHAWRRARALRLVAAVSVEVGLPDARPQPVPRLACGLQRQGGATSAGREGRRRRGGSGLQTAVAVVATHRGGPRAAAPG